MFSELRVVLHGQSVRRSFNLPKMGVVSLNRFLNSTHGTSQPVSVTCFLIELVQLVSTLSQSETSILITWFWMKLVKLVPACWQFRPMYQTNQETVFQPTWFWSEDTSRYQVQNSFSWRRENTPRIFERKSRIFCFFLQLISGKSRKRSILRTTEERIRAGRNNLW